MAKEKKKENKKSKTYLFIKSVSQGICAVAIVMAFLFIWTLKKSHMVPTKYMTLIIAVLLIPLIFYVICCFVLRPKKVILIALNIITIPVLFGEVFGMTKINELVNFLDRNFNKTIYNVDAYYVVVNKDSNYKKLEDIKGKIVYYFDMETKENLLTAVNDKVKIKDLKKAESNDSLITNVKVKNDYIIIIHSSYYDTYVENDPELEKDVRIIAKDIEVKKKVEKKKDEDLPNVLKESTIVYLSGIDTRGGDMPERGLSDVNMIMVINPKTHKVLMVNIPRDYYVQLHGTTGLNDKLTHAGINGGVPLSIATIEDILDIKVDYYLRVNFNAVINLVDAIGGLTINSDVNYAFTCWTDYGCTIYPGDNQVGGRCALAFARERHAYSTGDRHRGENQQQVIRLIMDKVGSSKELLNNYSNILNALDGTFETNFSSDNIKDLVRHQLDKMPHWETITSNLDGSGAMKPTYSYPNQDLSVMIPDQTTIDAAKAKIKEIYNEK